jgi:hypothetical protein
VRCLSCDCNLSDFESTRKSSITGDFLDVCSRCLGSILDDVSTVENWNLYDERVDDFTSLPAGEEATNVVGTTDDDSE